MDDRLKHHVVEDGWCKACCCSHDTCSDCKGFAHSLGVVDEVCTEDYSDCWWIHEYLCEKCGKYWQA
jgi:hypothetical protein